MNKYWSILLMSTMATTALAQKTLKVNGVVAEGKVDSFGVINLSKAIIDNPPITYVKPDDKGKFVIEVPNLTEFNYIGIIHNNKLAPFLASKNEKLSLSLSLNEDPEITITSNKPNSSAIAYQKMEQQEGGFQGIAQKAQNVFHVAPSNIGVVLDSLAAVDVALISKQLDAGYIAFLKTQIDLVYHNALLMYGVNRIQSLGQNATPEQVQEFADASLKAPKVVNDKYIYYPTYQDYIMNYFLYQYIYNNLNNAGDANTNITQTLKLIENGVKEPKSAAFASAKLLHVAQKGLDPSVWNFLVKDLNTKYPKDPNSVYLMKIAEELQKFDPGKKALDFNFVTLEGEKKKLSDYKGKVVYLDFWASWCGPCRQQMPFAKEIKKHFEGKDVVFLYVSIDDTDDKWKRGIEAMGMEGVQTRSGGWGGDLPKMYNISSIPAYFLVDKSGNFAVRPPRPSQKQELIQLIEELLKK